MKLFKLAISLSLMHYWCLGQTLTPSTYATYDSTNRFYVFNIKLHITTFTNRNTTYFNFPTGTTYVQDFSTLIGGVNHYKFDQFHNGIKVENGSIYLRTINDTITTGSGLVNINIPSVSSFISASSAVTGLLSHLSAYKYKWNDTLWEQSIKEEKNDPNASYYPNPQLTIKKTSQYIFNGSSNYFYCYPIKISAIYNRADSIYSDSVYIVDAISGNILNRYSPVLNCYDHKSLNSNIPTCSQSCMATTVPLHYYTNQIIYTEKYLSGINCTHRLKDICTGTYLYVKQYNSSNNVDFKNNANTWTGGGSPSDKVGVTTMWCLRQTHDFFRFELGRNSYDNQYSQIKIIVGSASNIKTGWNVIDDNMDVGRFNLTASYECALDIIGHEVGHGVGDKVCFLTQDASIGPDDEEGALAEGYCDIFGQGVEHYSNINYSPGGAVDDFYQGGTLPFVQNKQRNFSSPNSTGNPDTYFGTNWITSSGNGISFAHRNSTVLSYWYYLICNGGSGTNDINNLYCVSPIGQSKAIKIAYLSLFYLGSTAKQYINARNATIQAAIQLYGVNSNEVAQITNAWYAVGIGSVYNGQINITNETISSPTTDYHYNSSINIQNVTVTGSGELNVSSNQQIRVTPSFASNIGGETHLYIAAGCEGGARPNNSSSSQNQDTTDSSSVIKQNIADRNLNFSISPNPSNGLFVVELDNNREYPTQIVVRDVLGRVVKTIVNPKEYKQEISLYNENNGVYVISVYYNDKIINERLMKN